MRRAHSRHRRT